MRSGETVRMWADCPTSVLNISARLVPSQSSEASLVTLRNGRIAKDSCGTVTVGTAGALLLNILSLKATPPAVRITASAPGATHFHGNGGFGGGIMIDALIGRLPSHASRSARISFAF